MTGNIKPIQGTLPFNTINKASVWDKSIRYGHPSALHLWWAQRLLARAQEAA